MEKLLVVQRISILPLVIVLLTFLLHSRCRSSKLDGALVQVREGTHLQFSVVIAIFCNTKLGSCLIYFLLLSDSFYVQQLYDDSVNEDEEGWATCGHLA